MMLVDSAIWVDHFAGKNAHLRTLLERRDILAHPLVIAELALGNLPKREIALKALQDLPHIDEATHAEALGLLNSQRLQGSGIGCVDLHLLTAVALRPGARLWTRDKRLNHAADKLGLAAHPAPA